MQKLSSKEVSALMAGQTSTINDIAQALLSITCEYKHLSPPVEGRLFKEMAFFTPPRNPVASTSSAMGFVLAKTNSRELSKARIILKLS